MAWSKDNGSQSAVNAAQYIDGKKPLIEQAIVDANEAKPLAASAKAESGQAKVTAGQADTKATDALAKATSAKTTAETVQGEFDRVVAEAGSNNPEVVQARGGEATLKARLDKTTAQLADIAKYIKPTGSGDDTAYLQGILNSHERIVIKKGTYFVNALTRLNVPSNRHIEWEYGAVFQVLTTYAEGYKALWIADKENVTLINPVILGERDTHIGTTGEYGFGIHIERSKNVKVFNPICNNMWGDGIIITDGEDVLIDQPICNNNRRQGMTISGKNITVREPLLTNSNGTPPQSGIDIEPTGASRAENIRIINPKTENCAGNGIHVNLEHIANTNRNISITIINHEDNGSSGAFEVYRLPNGLKGFIKYIDAMASNNKLAGISINNCSSENDVIIKIDNPTVINPNGKNNIPGKYGAGIAIFRETVMTSSYLLGNVVITNPTIIDNRVTSQLYRGIEVIDEKNIGLKNIKIVDPLEIKGLQNPREAISVDRTGVSVLDSLGVTANKISESITLHSRQSISKIETVGTTATPTITMGAVKPINVDTLTLEVGTGHGIIFKPDPSEVIRPISTVSGQSIKSMQVGASITLKKKSTTTWIVTQLIGEWTIA